MNTNQVTSYLIELEKHLRRRGFANPDELEEIESHLLEAVEYGLRRGLSQEEAEGEALQRFGPVKVIAQSFEKERRHPMQKILFVLAAVAGLFFVYVDTRPTWDDTGILVGSILLVCGVLGLIGFRRPWLLALLVGAWIPLHGILFSHSFASIIALVIALIGAYAGWAVRLGIQKILHPA